MKRVAIIGAGDLGLQILYHSIVIEGIEIVGFFDDYAVESTIQNIPLLGGTDEVLNAYSKGLFDEIVIAIGYKHMSTRRALFDRFNADVPFATLVHPSCIVEPTAVIGQGSILFPGSIVDHLAVIGNNVLINIGVSVSHHSKVGKHAFISPRVAIAGFVNIGSSCILGINSTIIDNLTICSRTQLGAATTVIRSIDKPGLYVGNPARYVR